MFSKEVATIIAAVFRGNKNAGLNKTEREALEFIRITDGGKQMDTKEYMVIIKEEIKTSEVISCEYNESSCKWKVEFQNGKIYPYNKENVERLTEPNVLNPGMYRIQTEGQEISNIKAIYVFTGKNEPYWHICFNDDSEKTYCLSELGITESCLNQSRALDVFEYINKIAGLSNIKNENGETLLLSMFNAITFVGNDVALAKYLNPSSFINEKRAGECALIFPFGCNNSQYKAVKNAMENQISVIQGPPGTGKTQTILNIIANILMQGKTVQVVSNNNSAIKNVYEKLESPKYNLDFLVAMLGNSENKKLFFERQDSKKYPGFLKWKLEYPNELYAKIVKKSAQLKMIFDNRERLACLRQEFSQLVTERAYFNQYIEKSGVDINGIKVKRKLSSRHWMRLWQDCRLILEEKTAIGFWFKIKAWLKYGIKNWNFYEPDISKVITVFQAMYYETRNAELITEINNIEKYLNSPNDNPLELLCDWSISVLKDNLARRYEERTGTNGRRRFEQDSLRDKPNDFLDEYPVILSTTFASKNSLNSEVVYDYLIMDEASQVDIATGALALSCAKNAVIVGDTKQLPNVITEDVKNKAKDIFDSSGLNEGYQYVKSFLQSILDVMPDVAQTLLREHYRCHPKIINFCNQKFYNGELIIMTEDKGEKDVLSVVKTVKGNHERNRYSQRQIDVIKEEIISQYALDLEETGIIAPYKKQVEALNAEMKGGDAATVHKFQGKEKANIIISTVDDEISDFVDNPHLINVAVSRAQKKLILVITGNEQSKKRNIMDLVDYIKYNKFEVIDSKIYSIFDYLYKQYTAERIAYLRKHRRISKYDSENLMYSLIEDILLNSKYSSLGVVCHFPLNMLIKNPELLDESQFRYVMNPATHLDFLIYNEITKRSVLAIEVDGYKYHKNNKKQGLRDSLKNEIMKLYEIPLLRFATNGSGERKKIIEELDRLL